jgi:hypothetical protein
MFNFEKIVHLVLEQPTPTATPAGAPPLPLYEAWFNDILKKHKQLGLGEVTENDVKKVFQTILTGYISAQDIANVEKHIHLLDVLKTIYDEIGGTKPKTIDQFFKNPGVKTSGKEKSKIINQYTNKQQWELNNPVISNAYKPGANRLKFATQAASSLAAAAGARLYG